MENAKKFIEALQKDASLAEKLKDAGKAYEGKELTEQERTDAIARDLLPIAKAAGFDVTAEELIECAKAMGPPAQGEVSDDEMDAVAGGANYYCWDDCFCAAIGNGNHYGASDRKCSCFMIGEGEACFCKPSYKMMCPGAGKLKAV